MVSESENIWPIAFGTYISFRTRGHYLKGPLLPLVFSLSLSSKLRRETHIFVVKSTFLEGEKLVASGLHLQQKVLCVKWENVCDLLQNVKGVSQERPKIERMLQIQVSLMACNKKFLVSSKW